MNKLLLFVLLTAFLCVGLSPQVTATTFRVNNNLPTSTSQRIFNTLVAANSSTSVLAGDTLLVEGSGTEYAGFPCTKKLTIIGPGYFLTQNAQNQANPLGASVQQITFNAGSEGSALIGLTFSTSYSSNYPIINANNVAIMRCYLTFGIYVSGAINGLLVLQNYIVQNGVTAYYSSTSFANVIFKNNIVAAAMTITPYSSTSPLLFSNVENNVFLGNVKLEANSFSDNIIASPSATVNVTASSKLGNLITTAGQLPATGNTLVTSPTTLFVGLAGAANSTDGQYRLPTASPYLTAGYSGGQPGVFGGTEPYRLSGIPAIPTIYSLRADAVGSKQSGLNVTIGARVNP